MNELNEKYDAIFIGSGIGPMTAASLLARRKGGNAFFWKGIIGPAASRMPSSERSGNGT